MIDWLEVGKNGLWILGLAVALATLSWAHFWSGRQQIRLRTVLGEFPARLSLIAAWSLTTVGAISSATSLRNALPPAALLAAVLILGAVLVRRPKSAAAPAPMPRVASRLGNRSSRLAPLRRWAAFSLRVEPCLLLAAAPLLMFPGCLTPVILPLLILPWLGRRLILGRYTARTLLDWPIVVLIGVLPISMRMSWDPLHSLPKLSGIALGVLAFYALVNHVLLPRQVWIVGLGMAASGLAVSLLALVGTDWHVHWLTQKWFIPKEVYDYLPRLITGVAGSSAESGFHPNQVGAALCLFIPFTAAQLLLALPRHSRLHSPGDDHAHAHSETAGVRHRVLRGLLAVALTIMCFTALLTGARSALLGVGAGLLTVAWFRGRWFLGLMLLLGLLACGLLGHYVGSERLIGEGLAPSLAREIGWRLEIWQTALSMIRDQPWTGVGLNSFPLVANVRYPLTSFTPEEVLRLTHSHNVFLQVGVDLGIPGLVAYCALLMGFGASWWLTYKHSKELRLRAASVGLLAGMIAYHFCGLFDCMTLGAKPGVAIWAILGLMAALANLSSTDRAAPAGEEARSA